MSKPSRTFLGKVKKRVIGLETLLRLSQHGDGTYAFIPKDVIDVFSLLPGDRIQTKLVASYRLISSAEQEEAEATREEKVEPTLVIPRQRRRRRKPNLDSDIAVSNVEPREESEDEPMPEEEEENSIAEGELT